MTIQFLEPLHRAWNRMKIALFKPFDLHKWFVVGFTAFLAGDDGRCTGGSGGGRVPERTAASGSSSTSPPTAWAWLSEPSGLGHRHPLRRPRGHRRRGRPHLGQLAGRLHVPRRTSSTTASRSPSRGGNIESEGNSLFVWRLLFGVFTFVVFGGLFAFFFIQGAGSLRRPAWCAPSPCPSSLGFGAG
ncbi:MAG: hypothetical protein M0C28_20810 [Candidatus Moduliflexus flocculans]|nr:hypothetical protein [Candidatus Moduliflexus flocculans]